MNYRNLKLYWDCLKIQARLDTDCWTEPLQAGWRDSSVLKRKWVLDLRNEFELEPDDDVYMDSNFFECLEIKKVAEEEACTALDEITTIHAGIVTSLCFLFGVMIFISYSLFSVYKEESHGFIVCSAIFVVCVIIALMIQSAVVYFTMVNWNKKVVAALLRAEDRIDFEVSSAYRVRINNEVISLKMSALDGNMGSLNRVNTQKAL